MRKTMGNTQSNTIKRVAVFARASTSKQAIEGKTLSTQSDELLAFVAKEGWSLAKLETFVESGRKDERKVFDDFIDYCVDRRNKIDILLIKGIDRFCRQGSEEYFKIKNKLKKAGVRLVDLEGIIQGEKNTLEDLNFKYTWSTYEPSRANEIAKAEQAKDEVRVSLTRMISHEIRYTQLGYWSRNSVYGYQNKKIDTDEDGVRNILVEHPEEGFYIKKMFELKGLRKLSDQDIVDELNKLGFKSRILARRDKETQKKIGTRGGNPLTIKQLQRYLQRLVYAGVIKEKWTHDKPILAKFDGLVSVELFNKANEGKQFIEVKGEEVRIKENYSSWAVKRNKRNPLYPYKNVVLCPECGNSLLGSASTGKAGKKYPKYHCSRGHERFAENPETVNKLVEETLSNLQFSEEDGKLFKECFMLVYADRKSQEATESVKQSQTLDELKTKQESAYQTIKTTSSDSVKARAEREYEELEDLILNIGEVTARQEQKELNARLAYKKASHLMEHFDKVLIDRENVLNQEMLFKLAFKELPSYSDLLNGTLNLHPLFSLKSTSMSSKRQCVTPRRIELRLPG
jgi:site-specific DNA recombinase